MGDIVEEKEEKYYIYEWYNIENGEVFYVGKGSGHRYKTVKNRNKYFENYYNKHRKNCDVRKVFENLTEDEAYVKEIELISQYREDGFCKCNLDSGGLGGNKLLFDCDEHKNFYYACLRFNKREFFKLKSHEASKLVDVFYEYDIDESIISNTKNLFKYIFQVISKEDMLDMAYRYEELLDGATTENDLARWAVEDGCYRTEDDFWDSVYKY